MSRGTPIVGLRLDPSLRAEIEAFIERNSRKTGKNPPTITSWIIHAIREKLDKAKRAKKASAKTRFDQNQGVKHLSELDRDPPHTPNPWPPPPPDPETNGQELLKFGWRKSSSHHNLAVKHRSTGGSQFIFQDLRDLQWWTGHDDFNIVYGPFESREAAGNAKIFATRPLSS